MPEQSNIKIEIQVRGTGVVTNPEQKGEDDGL